jgi:CheY-like chemotaxis protein
MRILAVDDEPIFCDLLRTRLEQLGYRDVETAFTGQDALQVATAKTRPVDCFILDIRMMPMDGIELVRRLRAIPHHQATPIIMLSALTDKTSIDAAFMAGANDYIAKPLEMVELKIRLEMARNILAERAQARLLHEHVLKQEAILFPTAAFDGEIILDDVTGAVSLMSMENFLLKQGNMRLRQTSAICFNLPMAETYFQMMDPTYYAVLIGDMAQAVSRALSACPHMLACPGSGDIVALLIDQPNIDRAQIEDDLAHELEALRLRFSAIDMTLPQMTVGTPVRTGLLRMQCPTSLIDRARRAAGKAEDQRPVQAIA